MWVLGMIQKRADRPINKISGRPVHSEIPTITLLKNINTKNEYNH